MQDLQPLIYSIPLSLYHEVFKDKLQPADRIGSCHASLTLAFWLNLYCLSAIKLPLIYKAVHLWLVVDPSPDVLLGPRSVLTKISITMQRKGLKLDKSIYFEPLGLASQLKNPKKYSKKIIT